MNMNNGGNVQSPIQLSQRATRLKDDFRPLEYIGHWDGQGRAQVINTGSSAMITFTGRPFQPFIVGGPLGNGRYIFEQLHFHWGANDGCGCEHTLDGATYSMEAHAVHYNSRYSSFQEAVDKPDGLAVTGFFVQAEGDVDCPEFGKLVSGLKHIRQPKATVELPADCLSWMDLQDLRRHYYTYGGSLTTPPYFESVTWIVYRTPIYVSRAQVAAFRDLLQQGNPGSDTVNPIVNNFRAIQTPPVQPEVIYVRNAQRPLPASKL